MCLVLDELKLHLFKLIRDGILFLFILLHIKTTKAVLANSFVYFVYRISYDVLLVEVIDVTAYWKMQNVLFTYCGSYLRCQLWFKVGNQCKPFWNLVPKVYNVYCHNWKMSQSRCSIQLLNYKSLGCFVEMVRENFSLVTLFNAITCILSCFVPPLWITP